MKRGGDWDRQEFNENRLTDLKDPQELLAVDKALAKLADTDEQLANIVELSVFRRTYDIRNSKFTWNLKSNRGSKVGLRACVAVPRNKQLVVGDGEKQDDEPHDFHWPFLVSLQI